MVRSAGLTTLLILLLTANARAIDWPIAPSDSSQPIGNSYGEFQDYGGAAYYHPGIDILAPAGTPVYAVKSGYVKAVLTIYADLHWRVAIGDSAGAAECDGWLYAHLDPFTITVFEGQWVEAGAYLGDLVHWPTANFHHLHFVKIRHSGETWDANWEFIGNPLDELSVIDDSFSPQFVSIEGSGGFAFCQNEAVSYFSPGDPVSGDVDIICRVDDMINSLWLVTPYRLEYKIEGDSSVPWTTSVQFSGHLDYDNNIWVVYQGDEYLNSMGDYEDRVFYFNLTNTDGDGIIETSDRWQSWQTSYFRNGTYMVYARAYDRAGNMAVDSMPVTVINYFVLSGTVTTADGNPHLDGALVEIVAETGSAESDSAGAYSISMVGGGGQRIRASRAGYETVDTTVMMSEHRQVDFVLSPADFVLGDPNFDGDINVGDAVYLISYIFREGPPPVPYAAGDVNADGEKNLGDAVYLINFIFNGGPPPNE